MTINGINGVNTQMKQMGMNQATDSYSRNIQSQIANAQKQLQELSSNEDMSLEELAEILSRYSQKQRYYRLKNGTFFQAGEELDGAISIVKTLQLKQKDLQKGKIAVPKYRALYLDGVARELGLDFKRDRNFKNLVRNMKTAEESPSWKR